MFAVVPAVVGSEELGRMVQTLVTAKLLGIAVQHDLVPDKRQAKLGARALGRQTRPRFGYSLSSVVASDLVIRVALVSMEVEDPQKTSFSSLKDDHFVVLVLTAHILD